MTHVDENAPLPDSTGASTDQAGSPSAATDRDLTDPSAKSQNTPAAPKDKTLRSLSSRRGVQTLFRVSYREQLDLTALADEKASMMIQVNGLIMSIMIASAGLIIGQHSWLLLPCLTLTLTALVSIVFAVFAARPKLNQPSDDHFADVKSGRENILFFGNFALLEEDQFVEGMLEMIEDHPAVYINMTRHIHGLGTVLLRKFRLLRIAYTVFLLGLLASVTTFILTLPGGSL